MAKYLVDTSIFVDHLRGRVQATKLMERYSGDNNIFL